MGVPQKGILFVCLWYWELNPGPLAHAGEVLIYIPSTPFIMRQEFTEFFRLALNL